MSAAAAPARPDGLTGAKIDIGKGREPWEVQDRIGRNKMIEKVIENFSGTGGNTTEYFQKYEALVKAENELGFDNEAEISMLNHYAKTSGDIQGKNKLQIIQMLEEKNILLPGGAGLYPSEEVPELGALARLRLWLVGSD